LSLGFHYRSKNPNYIIYFANYHPLLSIGVLPKP
jgi:hypothetical protein